MFAKRAKPLLATIGLGKAKRAEEPVDVWQGRAGDRLQKIGFERREGPGSAILAAQLRLSQNVALEEQCTEEANRRMRAGGVAASGRLKPLFMLPPHEWATPTGWWLINTFDILPCEPWNRIYLPDEEGLAFVIDSCVHPGAMPDELIEPVRVRIGQMRDELDAPALSIDGSVDAEASEQRKKAMAAEFKGWVQARLMRAYEDERAYFRSSSPLHKTLSAQLAATGTVG